jgi:Papain family cysteine protease
MVSGKNRDLSAAVLPIESHTKPKPLMGVEEAMRRGHARSPAGVLSFIVLLFMLGAPLPAFSQGVQNDDVFRRGQGLVLDTEDDLADFPRIPTYRGFLPDRVDLSDRFPVPGDQGEQNSCVGWAVGYAARAYYANKIDGRDLSNSKNIPSPAYIYNSIPHLPGPDQCGNGSKISDALKLLRRGAGSIAEFPYSEKSCPRPSELERSRATDFRIDNAFVFDPSRVDQIKGQLAHGHPVIIGLQTTREFLRLKGSEIYRSSGQMLNNHAVTVVGYDERLQAFKLINSWGRYWGDGGFGWMDYDTLRKEARIAYVLRVSAPHNPQPSPPRIVEPTTPPAPSPRPVVIPKPESPVPKPTPVVNPKPAPSPIPSPVRPSLVVLAELECSQVRILEHGGRKTFVGFVGKEDDLAVVRAAAKGAEVAVVVRPWPQCEALLTLDKPLSRSDRPNVMIRRTSGDTLASGERLVLEVETPLFPSYLHIAYIQADGTVLNLVQPGVGSFTAHPPRSKVVIGDGLKEGTQFKVSAPFGREMLIVLASRSPIFSDLRPTQETEREFLTGLRRALIAKPDPSAPDRDVSAGFDAITTVARGVQ